MKVNPVEVAAHEYCTKLLESKTAQLLPPDLALAFATIAFTLGAAWALDEPKIRDIANAQMESMRSKAAGSMS